MHKIVSIKAFLFILARGHGNLDAREAMQNWLCLKSGIKVNRKRTKTLTHSNYDSLIGGFSTEENVPDRTRT